MKSTVCCHLLSIYIVYLVLLKKVHQLLVFKFLLNFTGHCKNKNYYSLYVIYSNLLFCIRNSYIIHVHQWCINSGPRAKSYPQRVAKWPASLKYEKYGTSFIA